MTKKTYKAKINIFTKGIKQIDIIEAISISSWPLASDEYKICSNS